MLLLIKKTINIIIWWCSGIFLLISLAILNRLRPILLSPLFLSSTLIGSTILGMLLSNYSNDHWIWLQRNGSIITLIALLMTARSVIRDGKDGVGFKPLVGVAVQTGNRIGSNGENIIETKLTEETVKKQRNRRDDILSSVFSIPILILGTLVWGYSDLLNKVSIHNANTIAILILIILSKLILIFSFATYTNPT